MSLRASGMVRVSILVRTYNSERTIGEVLESLSAQSFRDYELIVVDSGSTDKTLDIVRRHPHVFVDYSKKKFTYGGSLNAGCAAAKGEYVVILSSHCVPLHREWLGKLVEAMDGDRQLAGAWGPLVFDVESYPVGKKEGVERIDLGRFLKRPNWGLQNPNAIIRRELWEKHHFSEEIERCEDQEWAHHFLTQGYNTAIVHGAEALYNIPHSPYQYGKKMMQDFVVLYDLFGYRADVPLKEFLRRSYRLAGAAVLGKRSPRVSALLISSMAGRWIADKVIRYRRLSSYLKQGTEPKHVLLAKLAASKGRQRLQGLRQDGFPRKPGLAADKQREKTRFFLVGEMRSGTSWLARTLNTHPEIFCKGEGSFFGRDQSTEEIPVYKAPTPSLYNAMLNCEGLRTWHSFSWNAWGKGDEEEDIRNITRLIIDYFMDKDSAPTGKHIVGDKSPLHTDHVDEIFEFYPEARVIHIFRDGRDVAVSLMHHFWRLSRDRGGIFDLDPEEIEKRDAYLRDPEGFREAGHSIFTEERLRQMAVRWSRRVSKASSDGRRLFGNRFFELRYEDLLARPEENLKAIFRLLGARADNKTVGQCIEKNRFEKLANRPKGQENSASFFRKGVAGDWRNVFTERDREIYEQVAGETLLKMGYPLD